MYLISYGTRPEIIKLTPLILKFRECKIPFLTLFTGQHETLIEDFQKCFNLGDPDIILYNIMAHGQGLDALASKILDKMESIYTKYPNIKKVIIQGDTTSSMTVALSAFHNKKVIIHLEAGLRTGNKHNPYPEEINRKIISQLADIHLCPTKIAEDNLHQEKICWTTHCVGNTIVDMYKFVKTNHFDRNYKNIKGPYYLVTLHRRENRGILMKQMWSQLNKLSSEYNFIYITHPSLPESKEILSNKITLLEPQNYINMIQLISNSNGIITDSGGLQEEAVCANKRVLICRKTTERPETVTYGLGLLVDTDISSNISFLNEPINPSKQNPYGDDVCSKIIEVI